MQIKHRGQSTPQINQLEEKNERGPNGSPPISTIAIIIILKDLWGKIDETTGYGPHQQNLTLSVSNTFLNPGSRNTTKSTPSSLIRAASSAILRRSSPASLIRVLVGRMQKSRSRITDKRGEVAGPTVVNAVGIHGLPPLSQWTPKATSWRFGK